MMLTAMLKTKGIIPIDFLEKGAIVNSTSFCQYLEQNLPYLLNDPLILAITLAVILLVTVVPAVEDIIDDITMTVDRLIKELVLK